MLVVIDPEQRAPKSHPLRRIKELADATLVQLSPTFDAIYSGLGRPSILARAALEDLAADGAVHAQKRGHVVRAARLQLLVPLVPRYGSGRGGLRPFDFFAQPPNALMENRHALLVDFQVEPADGYAERRAAIAMVDERLPGSRRATLGGDKGYDTGDFVGGVSNHVNFPR